VVHTVTAVIYVVTSSPRGSPISSFRAYLFKCNKQARSSDLREDICSELRLLDLHFLHIYAYHVTYGRKREEQLIFLCPFTFQSVAVLVSRCLCLQAAQFKHEVLFVEYCSFPGPVFRISARSKDFILSTTVRTGPGSHLASFSIFSFPVVKPARKWSWSLTASGVEVKNPWSCFSTFSVCLLGIARDNFTCTFTFNFILHIIVLILRKILSVHGSIVCP